MSNKAENKKRKTFKINRFLKILGPGIITGASDDDPSGIATYSQAGAKFGLATLWTALITFPLMAAIQEMCARIGIVTSQGLTTNIRNNYPKTILYLMILFTFPAVILNIGADIAGMGAVANLIFPSIPSYFFTIAFTGILMVLIIYLPYKKISAILKYLCVFLLLYLVVPFLARGGITEIASVEQAAKALEPLAGKLSYLLFALGVIGTGFLAMLVLYVI